MRLWFYGVSATKVAKGWGISTYESIRVPNFSSRVEGVCGEGNGSKGDEKCGGFVAEEVPHRVGVIVVLWD